MSERILVVAPYPPNRDGIGAYALQQVRRLRRAGNDVEVMSPSPSAAHHFADLKGPKGARRLAATATGFDRVIVHFHPEFFYHLPPTAKQRTASGLAYGAVFRKLGNVELRLHEIDQQWADPSDPTSKATKFMLRSARTIQVHSAIQRSTLIDAFGLNAANVTLVAHGSDFEPNTGMTREAARASLGLNQDEHLFLCIGFLQFHKGFDRAAQALARLDAPNARLAIVGSTRLDDAATREHLNVLRDLTDKDQRVELHEIYTSDEMFDRWIVAADTVVLPYRYIWSSSVVERALLFGRRLIVSDIEGLSEQVQGIDTATLVANDVALTSAMAKELGIDRSAVNSEPWPTADRSGLQAEIESRAAASKGQLPTKDKSPVAKGGARRSASPNAAKLKRLGAVDYPAAVSARPGITFVKKGIRRTIGWELDPIRHQVEELRKATQEAIKQLDD